MEVVFHEVSFAYERFGEPAAPPHVVLRRLNFRIGAAEAVAIVGRSGSGKTTLMQLFNGLLTPTAGRILVDGADIHGRGYDLAALRGRMGLAFQFPEAQLFGMTVAEDVSFGPRQQKRTPAEALAAARTGLAQVGLSPDFLPRHPMTLSQGEKRRVALAGILAMNPEMLILDEPTASLDAAGVREVTRLLRRWHQRGQTVVIVSHDMDLVAALAQRVLVLHAGEIIFDGRPAELWQRNGGTPPRDSHSLPDLLAQAGLPLPRAERVRRLLTRKGLELPGRFWADE
ncbi:MAG: ATP-binding cassette domain-containing protein [candidate division KSB1 bacterium]|nr:ATP-binding cassette domain-containing protein [candidate division KSB1 bacterium]MDZ7275214.1 ATP-binding cassette domain-containing protein [candidate division KSB1 bacterium]MDZ7287383.1 ATP-binding cassette domain-containing protein [candidate division KSB1 bacterium]MDZ7299497.1 ATP-binding cassette domain-containing protein [candidate division KSB1 bacterium]MDZ7305457.1 ATP-binding cassette domain-containing protein [candidate division KSB1 bacterium]